MWGGGGGGGGGGGEGAVLVLLVVDLPYLDECFAPGGRLNTTQW